MVTAAFSGSIGVVFMLWLVIAAATLQDGQTHLMRAADIGHTAAVQSLVGAGAGMNIQDEVSDIILIGTADHSETF